MTGLLLILILSGPGCDHRPWAAPMAFTGRFQRKRFEGGDCEQGFKGDSLRFSAWCLGRPWARFCLVTASKPTREGCRDVLWSNGRGMGWKQPWEESQP